MSNYNHLWFDFINGSRDERTISVLKQIAPVVIMEDW